MNKNKKHKTGIEIEAGVLPDLLKGGKAFSTLAMVTRHEHQQDTKKYKQRVYRKMNELLGDDAPKTTRSYREWFINPEKNVNEAFLERQRSNPKKWMIIVNAMYFSLSEVLMQAIEETRQQLALYQERENALSDVLNIYSDLQNN